MGASNLQLILDEIVEEMRHVTERGDVADYIPPLACISPQKFGIAVATIDGACHIAGDACEPFSIQSVSKVFSLTAALDAVGEDLWDRIGVEPSGSPFNSIVQLESEAGIPRNPFINAGAIVVADVLLGGRHPDAAMGALLKFVQSLADDDTIYVDHAVAAAEKETGWRNAALANYMRDFGNIMHDPADTLSLYFQQCSLALSCEQLAKAGRFLITDGVDPQTGYRVVTPGRARRINALMLTCGHYDGSGEFAFRVGLPGKSGVGGGILAIAPGIASIAVWSPGLNTRGNSKLGTYALDRLTSRVDWSIFEPPI
ncbi:Thermolabile glutaminase [Rhodobacteraceae bacterium THAF1]|uniref:glutaminase n=1 Tax=Palleronia sp. THAF1 TaxID=2587842 RepID=UPI000F41A172|nr:glutaminase [Palleronia sp. THAF1]QFU09477.1 Thermolabile glutaminase [Palleronia sp. THAF1]VDC21844.1 Thermolabile glutaminase [Rhodobacteraceae bacterium THAF1]